MSPAWNVVLLFELAVVGKSLAAKQCPPGREKGVKDGDCYSFSRRPGNWNTAVSLCELKNGTLASASSGFVNNFLRVKATRWAEGFYWLGGVYTENPLKNISGWRWLDDTPFKYTAWATVNPVPNRRRNHSCIDEDWSLERFPEPRLRHSLELHLQRPCAVDGTS